MSAQSSTNKIMSPGRKVLWYSEQDWPGEAMNEITLKESDLRPKWHATELTSETMALVR